MAEKDNIQFVEQQVAALNARDLEGYLSRIDDSYVGASEIAPGPICGHEGVKQNIGMLFEAFPDVRLEIKQIIASGDSVAVLLRITGTHKGNFAGIAPTNKSFVIQGCNVVEVRNGKAIQAKLYADNVSLLQQLGVLPLPKATAAG